MWRVSVNTVADSMRRQDLRGRKVKRNRGLTRQDRTAAKFPDLLKRDFTAAAANLRWVGDMTEIPTDQGKLYLATVIDLYSRRLLAAPSSEQPNAELAMDAITMAVAVRSGSAMSSSTPTADRPTPRPASRPGAPVCTSARAWAESGHAWTTQRPSRASPPWSGRS